MREIKYRLWNGSSMEEVGEVTFSMTTTPKKYHQYTHTRITQLLHTFLLDLKKQDIDTGKPDLTSDQWKEYEWLLYDMLLPFLAKHKNDDLTGVPTKRPSQV